MKLLVSFVTTEYQAMKLHWDKYSILSSQGKVGTSKPIGKHIDLGGCLIEIDWESKEVVKKVDLSCPSGFDYTSEVMIVASMRKNTLYILDKDFQIIRYISHPYFNDIHSVSISSAGLIVTSTGIDSIIELNLNGEILWSWHGFQHGYAKDKFGVERCLDFNRNHNLYDYPTLTQTTHVNSAIESPKDTNIVYASLFHQGEIIKINKDNKKHSVVYRGLKNCHAICPFSDGFIVSDTKGMRICVFDKDFRYLQSIPVDSNWIADAFATTDKTHIVSDAHNFQISEIDNAGNIISAKDFNQNWKIYQSKISFNE
jgi:hypothetical protein